MAESRKSAARDGVTKLLRAGDLERPLLVRLKESDRLMPRLLPVGVLGDKDPCELELEFIRPTPTRLKELDRMGVLCVACAVMSVGVSVEKEPVKAPISEDRLTEANDVSPSISPSCEWRFLALIEDVYNPLSGGCSIVPANGSFMVVVVVVTPEKLFPSPAISILAPWLVSNKSSTEISSSSSSV